MIAALLRVWNQRRPPLLYSFPGSGNTWVRLLIELSTGIYTGSVYDDHALREMLPGEGACDDTVSVVKVVHLCPHDFIVSFSV